MSKKIVIAAGNGFLGTALTKYFGTLGYTVVVLARSSFAVPSNTTVEIWDGKTQGPWCEALENAEALINLAGKSVNCRYTEKNKREIYDSRLESTRVLGEAIQKCIRPPALWINSSSATIYNASFAEMMTEESPDLGDDFSMGVCKKWQEAFNEFLLPGTRKVIIRTSIVLGNDGGALPTLRNLVRCGLGGMQGPGTQFCSWVHLKDFCRAVEFLMKSRQGDGVYNVTAPNPLTNRRFMGTLADSMRVIVRLPTPELLLRTGAIFIGTEPELVLKSRKVFPKRLLDEGFVFEFDELKDALLDLCSREVTIKQSSISLR